MFQHQRTCFSNFQVAKTCLLHDHSIQFGILRLGYVLGRTLHILSLILLFFYLLVMMRSKSLWHNHDEQNVKTNVCFSCSPKNLRNRLCALLHCQLRCSNDYCKWNGDDHYIIPFLILYFDEPNLSTTAFITLRLRIHVVHQCGRQLQLRVGLAQRKMKQDVC